MSQPASDTLLAYCRPGFEGDAAAELTDWVGSQGQASYCRAPDGQAYLTCHIVDGDPAASWRRLQWQELVFARQLMLILDRLHDLPASDRASPIAKRVRQHLDTVSDVWLEHPDTNEGKQLSRFCRRFAGAVRRALSQQGIAVDVAHAPRLHLFFTDSSAVTLAMSEPTNSSPWPQGIPRLRMPQQAPSRSTLKLEEALHTFMAPAERESWLAPGMTAVDLGAAPGGWSWQLAQRSIHVTAIDNAPVDSTLTNSGLVEHVTEDGFRYRPARAVDWLVCDIVEQPGRIVDLVLAWIEAGDCGGAIANLKLPMKQRRACVNDALTRIRRSPVAGWRQVGAKQLYHDREEITLFVAPWQEGTGL